MKQIEETSNNSLNNNECTSKVDDNSRSIGIDEQKNPHNISNRSDINYNDGGDESQEQGNKNQRQEIEAHSSSSTTSIKEKIQPLNETTEDDDEQEKTEICMICHEEFEDGEELRRLMCMCSYHKSCIDKWLEDHDTCPVDRRNIINPDHTDTECNGGDSISLFN